MTILVDARADITILQNDRLHTSVPTMQPSSPARSLSLASISTGRASDVHKVRITQLLASSLSLTERHDMFWSLPDSKCSVFNFVISDI